MRSRFRLAKSPWPRTGHDRRNSALAPFESAKRGVVQLSKEIPLRGSVVVDELGRLIVSGKGKIACLSRQGKVLWGRVFQKHASAALALSGGDVLVNARYHSYLLTPLGRTTHIWETRDHPFDDSGPSPNLTLDGRAVVTTLGGEVILLDLMGQRTVGSYGYDVLPPAILDSGSFGIAGYSGDGACLIAQSGQRHWKKNELHEADLQVSANHHSELGFGDLNTEQTQVLTETGQLIFRLSYPALLTEHPTGWIATGGRVLEKLSSSGQVEWSKTINNVGTWALSQSCVDRAGRVYVPVFGGIRCFQADGTQLFELVVGKSQPGNIALLPGRVAFVCDRQLVVAS